MTVIEILNNAGTNPYMIRARRRYRSLTDEQRTEIALGFRRHVKACQSLGIDPDPGWIAEAVDDMMKADGSLGRREVATSETIIL